MLTNLPVPYDLCVGRDCTTSPINRLQHSRITEPKPADMIQVETAAELGTEFKGRKEMCVI